MPSFLKRVRCFMSNYPQYELYKLRAEFEENIKKNQRLFLAITYSLFEQIKAERLGLLPEQEGMLRRILQSYGVDGSKNADILYSKEISPQLLQRWEEMGMNPEGEGELNAYLQQNNINLLTRDQKLDLLKDNEDVVLNPSKTRAQRPSLD